MRKMGLLQKIKNESTDLIGAIINHPQALNARPCVL